MNNILDPSNIATAPKLLNEEGEEREKEQEQT
jgi:hypothetical protein